MSGHAPELPYDFAHVELCELALTHSSVGLSHDNERLEFLGDAALDLVVAEELYRHHQDLPEGDLTELKASVVSRRTLADAARRLDLERRARVGPGLRSRTLPRPCSRTCTRPCSAPCTSTAGSKRRARSC
ncbi:MAG: hypothetical protein IPJ77_04735 [Planctomycetes bacterium]|nr:hypothetical protein [Planctomycetota bacterium]